MSIQNGSFMNKLNALFYHYLIQQAAQNTA